MATVNQNLIFFTCLMALPGNYVVSEVRDTIIFGYDLPLCPAVILLV